MAVLVASLFLASGVSGAPDPLQTVDQVVEQAMPHAAEVYTTAVVTLEETHTPSLHCQAWENPHRYVLPAPKPPAPPPPPPQVTGPVKNVEQQVLPVAVTPIAEQMLQAIEGQGFRLAGTVVLHDGSVDCEGAGPDLDGDGEPDIPPGPLTMPPDGDYEYAVGGGFFPANHHGAGFEIVDYATVPNVYTVKVGFTVASDADGDGWLENGECREQFIRNGVTTCPAGADGGWWVILHGRIEVGGIVSDPPTSGYIVSGPAAPGSQRAGLPVLASVTILYENAKFRKLNPGGWVCPDSTVSVYDYGWEKGYTVSCSPPAGFDWRCQGPQITGTATRKDTASLDSSTVQGSMLCGAAAMEPLACDPPMTLHSTQKSASCKGGPVNINVKSDITCSATITTPSLVKEAAINCYNDP